MNNFRVKILDRSRQIVYSYADVCRCPNLSTQFLLSQSLDNEMVLFHSTHTQNHLKVSCLICHKSLKLIHLQFLKYVTIRNLIKYIQSKSFAILLLLTFSPGKKVFQISCEPFCLTWRKPFCQFKVLMYKR